MYYQLFHQVLLKLHHNLLCPLIYHILPGCNFYLTDTDSFLHNPAAIPSWVQKVSFFLLIKGWQPWLHSSWKQWMTIHSPWVTCNPPRNFLQLTTMLSRHWGTGDAHRLHIKSCFILWGFSPGEGKMMISKDRRKSQIRVRRQQSDKRGLSPGQNNNLRRTSQKETHN